MTEPTTDNKHVPWAAVIVCAAVAFVVVCVCATYLLTRNIPLADFKGLLVSLFSGGSLLLSGFGAYLAGSANKRAGTAVDNTNGSLDKRLENAIRTVLTEREVSNDNN